MGIILTNDMFGKAPIYIVRYDRANEGKLL